MAGFFLAMVFGDFWPGTHRQPVLAAHITEPRRKRFGPHIPRSPGNLPRAGRSGSYRNQEISWNFNGSFNIFNGVYMVHIYQTNQNISWSLCVSVLMVTNPRPSHLEMGRWWITGYSWIWGYPMSRQKPCDPTKTYQLSQPWHRLVRCKPI